MKTKKKSGKAGPVLIALALIVIAAAVLLIQRYTPTKERMNQTEYFGAMADNEVAVILQDQMSASRAVLSDGALYLNYDLVRQEINSRFYWDEGNNQMLYTTALETFEIPVNSADYTVDGAAVSYTLPILLQNDSGLYLSIDFLQQYTNMEYTLVGTAADSGDTASSNQEGIVPHVLITYQWGSRTTGTASRETAVRYQGGIKSPVLTQTAKGDTVYVLETLENWTRVLTKDGYIGYVQTKRLENVQDTEITRDFIEPEYSSLTKDTKVSLVWHQIDNSDANSYLQQDIADMTGVDVISPTWFSVTDNSGTMASLASADYVTQAHAAGLEVWGLVSNFSADVDTVTLLASTEVRRRMVDYLVSQAQELGLDGINLDFEYITEEAGYSYVQFARELSVACRKSQLVFSIDVPVPMDFNQHFDRRELGTIADYIIIMGYDEHYAGSESAGSVASLSFEENGINGTLTEVPVNKIISAVPFYTRIWYTVLNADGTTSVTSEAISMNTAQTTLDTYGVTPSWNEDTQQNYASWTAEDGTLCEIWLEDETSLALKAQLVKTYDLGGIAAWVLGFERDTVWKVLSENIA